MTALPPILYLAAALFVVGAWGVLARRNLVIVLISLEVMMNAAVLALVAFARYHAGAIGGLAGAAVGHEGQIFALYVLALAAAEAAVGLAILLAYYRKRGSADAREATGLKG